jgi:hypothetical protein
MSTTHKSAARTKYWPGATMAGFKWKNLLDQSREETHRIKRGVKDETGNETIQSWLTRPVIRPII